MNAFRTKTVEKLESLQAIQEERVDPKEFTYYVHLLNGAVKEVAPVSALRLTNTEVVFVLGELVVARLPRREIYFAAREPNIPPVPC